MPPGQPPKKPEPPRRPAPQPPQGQPTQASQGRPTQAPRPQPRPSMLAPTPPVIAAQSGSGELGLGIAVSPEAGTGTVTARKAGGLKDLGLVVDPAKVGLRAALQHLAKAVNIAFQADYGENDLEAVYQAAVVRNGEIRIIHREYFGFGDTWLGQFGRLLRSLSLSFEGPDPASPEGQRRFAEKGPSSIRGLLSVMGRKLDLVTEYEDRVPASVEQMFDRLEASGIIAGWSRDDWEITTTSVGLDVRISPKVIVDVSAASG
jgi:hypothetical protein